MFHRRTIFFVLSTMISLLFFTTSIQAAQSVANSQVISIKAGIYQGKEWVAIEFSTLSGTSGCSTDNSPRLTLDPTTGYGKVMLSLAMQAKATGKTVTAAGANSCRIDGIEDLKFLQLNE